MRIQSIYLMGSLRNPDIIEVARDLRARGFEVFDNWYAAGPEADDHWKAYEQQRGLNYIDALDQPSARTVFEYDRKHIDRCDAAVLVLPAGRSGHLELGYAIGKGKPGFILLDQEHDRWDVMYRFATSVVREVSELRRKIDAYGELTS